MRLRPLRDSLERLTEMERALRVIDTRLCKGTALKAAPAPVSESEGEAANDDTELEAQIAERF
ncbi:MAG TPA: hypothetical protein VGD21_04110 [Lysobacter sp.]